MPVQAADPPARPFGDSDGGAMVPDVGAALASALGLRPSHAKPLLMALLAGASTSIGGVLVIAMGRDAAHRQRLLPRLMAAAAGVMIYLSFADMMADTISNPRAPPGAAHGTFFGGVLTLMAIQALLPAGSQDAGRVTSVLFSLHNALEGAAVALTAGHRGTYLGLALALAIALHNIPEGMAVAGVTYARTGSRARALMHATFSGLWEPLSAVLALALVPAAGPGCRGRAPAGGAIDWLLPAAIAGTMVYVSLLELIPFAVQRAASPRAFARDVCAGMAVMAAALELVDRHGRAAA